jgi:hypothetical protein
MSTMGIDVSNVGPHVMQVSEWYPGFKKVIKLGRVDWGEIREAIRLYHPVRVIIDANPERNEARRLCEEFPGTVFMAFYPEGLTQLYSVREDNSTVSIHRTEAISATFGRFKAQNISLPNNSPFMRDYAAHMCALTKTFKENRGGQLISRYVLTGTADHFAHAATYDEVAGRSVGLDLPVMEDIITYPEDPNNIEFFTEG